MSLGIAALTASFVGVWAYFFAVSPVWSASEQMQAEQTLQTEAETPLPAIAPAPVPSPRLTWEQAVAAFVETYEDVPMQQDLIAFYGVEPQEFFRMRQSSLASPRQAPQEASGLVKLYMIPGKTYFFRLEDYSLPPGPGYEIALTTAQRPATGQDIRAAERYQFLTAMENFRGSRNILINPEVLARSDQSPTRFNSLVVWNPDYDVVIATASLE